MWWNHNELIAAKFRLEEWNAICGFVVALARDVPGLLHPIEIPLKALRRFNRVNRVAIMRIWAYAIFWYLVFFTKKGHYYVTYIVQSDSKRVHQPVVVLEDEPGQVLRSMCTPVPIGARVVFWLPEELPHQANHRPDSGNESIVPLRVRAFQGRRRHATQSNPAST